MFYPDEEKITYSYNLGGQLEKVHGYKSYGYDYVSKIGYDKFEQRTYLKYCYGAEVGVPLAGIGNTISGAAGITGMLIDAVNGDWADR